MGRFDALTQIENKPVPQETVNVVTTPVSPTNAPLSQEKPIQQVTHQSINQSIRQSTKQSIKRSTKQQISQLGNKIVEKPKGFYITQRLDKKLDEAVRYLQEVHGIKKADRSTIVNAILDNEANWTEEALDLLVDPVIGLLTSRLMS